MIHGSSRKAVWYPLAIAVIVAFLSMSLLTANFTVRAQQPIVCNSTYVVQPGDDLFQISLRFGVTIPALQTVNNIGNANLIFVGQVLCIPAGTAPVGLPYPYPYQYPYTGQVTPFPYLGGPTPIPGIAPTTNVVGDIGVEPPVNAIGNFLEICGNCSNQDINATQRQFRQNTLVCASVKPIPGSGAVGWYRVNDEWCGWYPSF